MFSLTSEKASVVYGVLFDVGSESIGVAILESDHSKTYPTVIFSHRIPLRISKKELSAAEGKRYVKEALFSASLILSREGIQALTAYQKDAQIRELLLVVSGPWSRTYSRKIEFAGEAEFKVTRALIDDLVASSEAEIDTHVAEDHGDAVKEFQVVERATVDVRINDYPIHSPVGLFGKEISLSQVTGVVPTALIKTIKEVEEKIFPAATLRSHTFLLVLFCVLRELYPNESSMTVLHVTGESTEIGIVENGTLVESISLPLGLNSLLRLIMEERDHTSQEAQSELLMYHTERLSAAREKNIAEHCNTFCTMLSKELVNVTFEHVFSGKAYVLAPTPFTHLFTDILKPFIQNDLAVGEIKPVEVTVSEENSSASEDTNISLASRFFHKLHGCGELSSE